MSVPLVGCLAGVAVIVAPPAAAQTLKFVCNSDQIFQGKIDQEHHGGGLADAGHWGSTSVFLSGGRQRMFASDPQLGILDRQNHGRIALYEFAPGPQCGATTNATRSILGEDIQTFPADRFGQGVTFLGDLDGDGRDDFAVGAPSWPQIWAQCAVVDPPCTNYDRGRVYVFLTSHEGILTGGPTSVWTDASQASLIIEGEADLDQFGYSLAGPGNFLHEAYAPLPGAHPDLAVGAPGSFYDPNLVPGVAGFPGRLYVFEGAEILHRAEDYVAGIGPQVVMAWQFSNYAIVDGLAAGDRYGFRVEALGSITGPACNPGINSNTLGVGAPGMYLDLQGSTYVTDHVGPGYAQFIHSVGQQDQATSLRIGRLDPESSAGVIDTNALEFGFSICGVDLDGDGEREVLVGSPLWTGNGPSGPVAGAGRVWAYDVFMLPGDHPCLGYPKSAVLWTLEGRVNGVLQPIQFGFEVSAIGPRDATSGEEFGVGAWKYIVGTTIPGACPTSAACHAVPGSGCQAGGTGCPLDDAAGSPIRESGRAEIFSGSMTAPALREVYIGEDASDSAGDSIARVGDLDGDGRHDLLLSSFRWPDPPILLPPTFLREVGRIHLYLTTLSGPRPPGLRRR